MTDMADREIKRLQYDFSTSDKTTIDLTGYAAGIYNVKITGNQGTSQVLRVVKE